MNDLYKLVRIVAGFTAALLILIFNYEIWNTLAGHRHWQLDNPSKLQDELMIFPPFSAIAGVMVGIAMGPQWSARWIVAGVHTVVAAFTIRSLLLVLATLFLPVREREQIIQLYTALFVLSVAIFSLLRCAMAAPVAPWPTLRKNVIGYLLGVVTIVLASAPYEAFRNTMDPAQTGVILMPIFFLITVVVTILWLGAFGVSMYEFWSAVSSLKPVGAATLTPPHLGKARPSVFCSRCGRSVAVDIVFCVSCGSRQDVAV